MRKKPIQDRAKFTFNSILDAMSQVLTNGQKADTTTSEVAERAGVSVGSLYQYFGGKKSIASALAQRQIERDFESAKYIFESNKSSPADLLLRKVFQQVIADARQENRVRQYFFNRISQSDVVPLVLEKTNALTELIYDHFESSKLFLHLPEKQIAVMILSKSVMSVIFYGVTLAPHSASSDEKLASELTTLVLSYLAAVRT